MLSSINNSSTNSQQQQTALVNNDNLSLTGQEIIQNAANHPAMEDAASAAAAAAAINNPETLVEPVNTNQSNADATKRKRKKKNQGVSLLAPINKFQNNNPAINDVFVIYRCVLSSIHDLISLMNEIIDEIVRVLQFELQRKKLIKFHFCLSILFEKDTEDGMIYSHSYFWSKLIPLYLIDDIVDTVNNSLQSIESQIDQFTERGSGWRMIKSKSLI